MDELGPQYCKDTGLSTHGANYWYLKVPCLVIVLVIVVSAVMGKRWFRDHVLKARVSGLSQALGVPPTPGGNPTDSLWWC